MRILLVIALVATNIASAMAQSSIPDPVKQAISRSRVGANNELLASSEDQKLLYQFARESWRQLLPQLSQAGLDARSQRRLMLAAIEALPDQDYLPFVTESLRLFSQARLPKELGKTLLVPVGNKEGFLPVSHDNPELANALRAALPHFADPDDKAFAEKVLSGAAKQEYLKWAADQGVKARTSLSSASAQPTIPTAPSVPPVGATPTPSTPVPTATPIASPAPTTPVAQTPAAIIERKAPVWPWLVGIAVLTAFLALVFKRRA